MAIDDRITFGRSVIYTDEKEINSGNVTKVLEKALQTHTKNRSDIQYLFDVYRGKMDIYLREKTYNKEITNKIAINYPFRIVNFKTGYELGKPIQYTYRDGREHSDTDVEELIRFNDYMEQCGKHTEDISLWEWICIAGIGFRFTGYEESSDPVDAPMYISIPDPRYTFVVYDRSMKRKQMMCCTFSETEDNRTIYYVYTDNAYYRIEEGKIVDSEPYYGIEQPIVEYKFNNAYLGAFEVVLSLVNATCRIASNRVDGVEQFIQALMMFKGVNIESQDYKALREEGAIVVPPDGDIKYLISELNQEQTQTLLDSIYDEMMEIVGIPRRRKGGGLGDANGISVVYQDGWEEAESHAQGDETMFKKSEQRFLKLATFICNDTRGTHLRAEDIQTNFTRRNYENLINKADAFATMIATGWVDPSLLFEQFGMFTDPELAWKRSKKFHDSQEAEEVNQLEAEYAEGRTEQAESV